MTVVLFSQQQVLVLKLNSLIAKLKKQGEKVSQLSESIKASKVVSSEGVFSDVEISPANPSYLYLLSPSDLRVINTESLPEGGAVSENACSEQHIQLNKDLTFKQIIISSRDGGSVFK